MVRQPRRLRGGKTIPALFLLPRRARFPGGRRISDTSPPRLLTALRDPFRGGGGGQARRGETPGTEPGGRRNENRSEHPVEDISEKEGRAATEGWWSCRSA